MTDPVTPAIKYGQIVRHWSSSPWRADTLEQQVELVKQAVDKLVFATAITGLSNLDHLHWINVASLVRSRLMNQFYRIRLGRP